MERRVRVLLIAAALGLALPSAQVQPAAAGGAFCPAGSAGGNDGVADCLIYLAAEGERVSMGSVWRPFPSAAPDTWKVRFYVNGVRHEVFVECEPAPTGFTAKLGTFEGFFGVVGHCWTRGVG